MKIFMLEYIRGEGDSGENWGVYSTLERAAIRSMRTRLKARAEDYKSIAGRTVELPKSNQGDQSQGQQAGQAGQQHMPQQPAQRPMSPTGFGGYDPRTRKVIQNR